MIVAPIHHEQPDQEVPLTGADVYAGMDQAKIIPFDQLPERDQFLFNLFAEMAEEVWEEQTNVTV